MEFDPPLGPDPAIALTEPAVTPYPSGPAHRAQYVIELVGPRSVPASAAAQLWTQSWQNALGRPEIYSMRPADTTWQPMTDRQDGSYDSLALCWDMVSPLGRLSTQSANQLQQNAEQLAKTLGRRAMTMPVPKDVDRTVRDLVKIQDQFDVGVSLAVIAKSGVVNERDLWIICSKLGLQFSPGGSFDWRSPLNPNPLLSVTPIGNTEAFSLGAVQKNATHEGVTVGFSVPRCPAPMAALEGAFQVSNAIARAINGAIFDDNSQIVGGKVIDEMRKTMEMAVTAFGELGIIPGSPTALKLF